MIRKRFDVLEIILALTDTVTWCPVGCGWNYVMILTRVNTAHLKHSIAAACPLPYPVFLRRHTRACTRAHRFTAPRQDRSVGYGRQI